MQAWPPQHNASGKKDKKSLVCKKLRFVKTNRDRDRERLAAPVGQTTNTPSDVSFSSLMRIVTISVRTCYLLLHSIYSTFSHQPPFTSRFCSQSKSLFKYFWIFWYIILPTWFTIWMYNKCNKSLNDLSNSWNILLHHLRVHFVCFPWRICS